MALFFHGLLFSRMAMASRKNKLPRVCLQKARGYIIIMRGMPSLTGQTL